MKYIQKKTKSKRIGIYFAIYIGRRQKKVIIIDILFITEELETFI